MMETPVDHAAMPACGFAWPWSLRAGGRVALHASSADADATVTLRRLDDPSTSVPWLVETGPAPLGHRNILRGSWVELDGLGPSLDTTLRLELMIPRNATPRTLLAWGGIAVTIDPERRLTLAVGGQALASPTVLPGSRWLALELSCRDDGIALTVREIAKSRGIMSLRLGNVGADPPPAALLRLGRGPSGPAANWRLGRIALEGAGRTAEWRFPVRGPVGEVPPHRGAGPALRVLNDPTFACTSPRWDGSVHDPRLAVDHYDAIHLHEDDLGGLDWPASHAVDVPPDAPSGVYAFEIATRFGTEQVPFFVRPDRPHAAIAVLVPTMTYAAYADEALPAERFPWVCDDRAHRFAQGNGLLSLYDEHADGSGVSLKNLRHPKATLRPDYRYPLSGSPHLLSVDLDCLAFCHANGIAFDLLTDGDLHAEGAACLDAYAGLFTGSHPEYWTTPMQDGLAAWLAQGGNLAHLGGNGFMWVTAFDGTRVEVRRGQTLASRTWDGLPGEAVMALTGEIGGLWRERGRSEFAVIGTGMTLMGFGPAQPYRRLPVSETAEWAWIFEGVAPGPIGTTGRVLGGAAGYEVDRTDERLGTPPGTVVLARAEGFGTAYEIDGNDYFPGAAPERDAARRADMAVRRHEGGGFVLSVASVAWCGALPGPGEENAVGAITRNVLRGLARSPLWDGADLGAG